NPVSPTRWAVGKTVCTTAEKKRAGFRVMRNPALSCAAVDVCAAGVVCERAVGACAGFSGALERSVVRGVRDGERACRPVFGGVRGSWWLCPQRGTETV